MVTKKVTTLSQGDLPAILCTLQYTIQSYACIQKYNDCSENRSLTAHNSSPLKISVGQIQYADAVQKWIT